MSIKIGKVEHGHPYIDVLISPDGKTHSKFKALIDTGFSGFISLPVTAANSIGLKAHATSRFTLADGKVSDPMPLAHGFACVDGDQFVQGLVSISQHTSIVVGVDFLVRCGKAFVLTSKGAVVMDEKELFRAIDRAQELEAADAANPKATPPADPPK